MAKLPHPTWLRSFEAAARHGSFAAAAEELGLTSAAVSQQIRLLEQELDGQLFDRLPRGVALTDLGQAYAATIRKSFAEMRRATDTLFSRASRRTVRLRAPISAAALIIAPQFAAFHAENPDLSVVLTTFVWADRFANDGSDLDIRYGHGEWTDGPVTHLGHEHVTPVCHPIHADRIGTAPDLSAVARAGVVQIIGYEAEWQNMADLYGQSLEPMHTLAKVDSSLLALQMAQSGRGTTLVLECFLPDYLRSGTLTRPTEFRAPVQHAHYSVQRDGATAATHDIDRVQQWIFSLFQAARMAVDSG